MEYILGIDQGGSKTHVIVGDINGNILGLGSSYGACHSVKGMAYAMCAIRLATESALFQAKIARNDIKIIYAGMTGIDWEYEIELVTRALVEEFSTNNIYVVNDCIIAMRAGTDKVNSGVLCVGSGLNCAIRREEKEFIYGFYVDEIHQGGMAIGERALRAVFNAEIGVTRKTKLTEALLRYFHVDRVDELLHKKVMGHISSAELLALPIIVDDIAGQGDGVALKLLEDFGREISQYIIAGMEKFEMSAINTEIVLSGSIFKCKTPILMDSVVHEIYNYSSRISIVEAFYEPVVGALLGGLDLLGRRGRDIEQSLLKSAKRLHLIRIENNGGNGIE